MSTIEPPKVKVRVFSSLKEHVHDKQPIEGEEENVFEAKGNDLEEALVDLGGLNTPFSERLYEQGSGSEELTLRRFVNIYVNEEDVRFLEKLKTPLKNGDEVSIVPAIAGGSR